MQIGINKLRPRSSLLHSLRSKFVILAVLIFGITQIGPLFTTAIMPGSDAMWQTLAIGPLVIGVATLIIALIGAAWLSRNILAPLRHIQAAAHRISSGDYSVPVSAGIN